MKIRSHTFRPRSTSATPPEGSWIQKLSQKKCSVLVLVLQMGREYFLWSSCPPSRYHPFFHSWQLGYVSSQLWIGRCLLLKRFDSEAGEAGELEARETGDEHKRDHGKEEEERRKACKNSCRFLANFVVFLPRYFSRVFKP